MKTKAIPSRKKCMGRRISLLLSLYSSHPQGKSEGRTTRTYNSPLVYRWDSSEAHELQGDTLTGQLSAELGIHLDCPAHSAR